MKFFIFIGLLFCFTSTLCLEFDCSADHLEECTQQLLKFSREDVPVPFNETEVQESCG
jgi:hypothetical protein